MIGQKISHYRVLERLGGGGMGEVFQAEDLRLERLVALKFLPPGLGEDSVAKERFVQEAKATSALNHNNICTIHDIGRTEAGRLFIAMAFYQGRTLKQRLAAGPLPVGEALEIVEQVLEGLVKAHEEKIIHRDIKPANLMITRDGVVKILDFGLAKLVEEPGLTRTGTSVGTPAYMSPEQVRGEEVDHRTDLWSLGVTCYEMLAGRRPFRGESEAELLHAILYGELPAPPSARPGIAPAVRRFLGASLARDPDDRFDTAREALQQVRKARKTPAEAGAESDETPTLTWPGDPGDDGDPRTEPRRFRKVSILAPAALLAVLAVSAIWWWPGDVGHDEGEKPPAETISTQPDSVGEVAAGADGRDPLDRTKIVVLPFDNLGPPEHEYFAAGMTDEITSRMVSVEEIGVIARSSALRYADTEKSIAEIGTELGVAYVLEGTVRWAPSEEGPGQVRITPQFVRVSDETHLWADAYDATLDDVFAVQSDIARKVAGELGLILTDRQRRAVAARPTDNLDAYHAYLRGIHARESSVGAAHDLAQAEASFERAVQLAPRFALAWAELSKVRSSRYLFGQDRSATTCRDALEAAERAQEIAPDHPQVGLATAYYHYQCEQDYDRALKQLEQARQDGLAGSEALAFMGFIQRRLGQWRVATNNLEQAMDLDSRSPLIPDQLAGTYLQLGRYDRALDLAERAIALDPDFPHAYGVRSYVLFARTGDPKAAEQSLPPDGELNESAMSFRVTFLLLAGQYERALSVLEKLDPDFLVPGNIRFPVELARAQIFEAAGRREEAGSEYRAALSALKLDLERAPDDPTVHAALGLAYAGLGRSDEAIRHGERAVKLLPRSKDAFSEYGALLAQTYARLGETRAACDAIDDYLSDPAKWNLHLFEKHPAFAALRDEPCFREIRARHPPPDLSEQA